MSASILVAFTICTFGVLYCIAMLLVPQCYFQHYCCFSHPCYYYYILLSQVVVLQLLYLEMIAALQCTLLVASLFTSSLLAYQVVALLLLVLLLCTCHFTLLSRVMRLLGSYYITSFLYITCTVTIVYCQLEHCHDYFLLLHYCIVLHHVFFSAFRGEFHDPAHCTCLCSLQGFFARHLCCIVAMCGFCFIFFLPFIDRERWARYSFDDYLV